MHDVDRNQIRPDIANSVRAVAGHSHQPKEFLKCFRATSHLGLYCAGPRVNVGISVHANADYGMEDAVRKTTSGGAVLCHSSTGAWFPRKQKRVTLSTAEAEYVAIEDGVRKTSFVRGTMGFSHLI